MALASLGTPMLVLAWIGCIWAIGWARDFLIPLTLAVFLTCCLAPVVRRLVRMGIPRPAGAALAVAGVLALAAWGAYSLRDDTRAVLDELPDASRHLSLTLSKAINDRNSTLNNVKVLLSGNQRAEPMPVAAALAASNGVPDVPTAVVIGTKRLASLASQAVLVFFLVYFLLAVADRLPRKFAIVLAPVVPPSRLTFRILREIPAQLQRYVTVLLITNTMLGISIWLAFLALGVEHPGVWGVAAAALHLIPYVGPAVTAIAAGLATSMQFDSVSHGVLVLLVTLTISTLIGILLTSWLTGRAASMNTPAVFVSLLFWGWLWGLPGMLLGTPVTMALKVVCEHIQSLAWVSNLLGSEDIRAQRKRAPPPLAEWHLPVTVRRRASRGG